MTIQDLAIISLLMNGLLLVLATYLGMQPNRDRSHILRARLEQAVDTLGLRDRFPAGFDPVEPLKQLRTLLDGTAPRRKSSAACELVAAEADCRRMAEAIEANLMTGQPYDLAALSAVTAYRRRKGVPHVASPRLN